MSGLLLSGLLERLEQPECAWPIDPRTRQPLSLEAWAVLLATVCPEDYAEPPAPREPAASFDRESRVEVKARRHGSGLGLWHPGDLQPEDIDCLGIVMDGTPNGRPHEKEFGLMREVLQSRPDSESWVYSNDFWAQDYFPSTIRRWRRGKHVPTESPWQQTALRRWEDQEA